MFLLCNCNNEVLVMNYDQKFKTMDVCIFESNSSYANKLSFWQRLQAIMAIITKGTIYTDQIMLEYDQVKYLKDYLLNI